MSLQLTAAHRQWATRPDDERFLTLEALFDHVAARKQRCWTTAQPVRALRTIADDGEVRVTVDDPARREPVTLAPTHWAFGQLATYAQAPASYLRTLPAELAAINLQWGFEHHPLRQELLLLNQEHGRQEVTAATSPSYGRIWDEQVVRAVQQVNADGRWQVPAASYSATNPRRATTLYASDRDIFLFLVDPDHPIQVKDETLFRGFLVWNSEVGAAVFGLTTFLYRTVCDNRIIWGATDVRELRIRHTGGAPERFAHEGARYLQAYANESTRAIEGVIARAQTVEIPHATEADTLSWLRERGFTANAAKAGVQHAVSEEGGARSLWDIVNGVTAYARSLTNTDERVRVESLAGKLLNQAA